MIGRFSGVLEEHYTFIAKLEKELKVNIEKRDELNKIIAQQRRNLACYLQREKNQKDS